MTEISTVSKSRNTLESSYFSESFTNDKGDLWGYDDESVNDLPIPLGMHTSTQVMVNGKSMIYIIGGCTGVFEYTEYSIADEDTAQEWPWKCTDLSKYAYSYDPYTDSYRTLAPMPDSRYGHAAVEVDGKIWVIGGRSDDYSKMFDAKVDVIDTYVYVYDIAEDSWVGLTGFEKATAHGASFSLESGSLFYAGGFNNEYSATDEVFKVDITASLESGYIRSFSVAPLQVPRAMISAVTIDDFAIIAGGTYAGHNCEPLESVEEYNPYAEFRNQSENGDVWSLISELKSGAGTASLINLNDQVLVFSGVRNKECSQDFDLNSSVQALDWKDTNSKWYLHGVVPERRYHFSTIPLPERNAALIFGGTAFYEAGCNCMMNLPTVSAYYTSKVLMEVQKPEAKWDEFWSISAISIWVVAAVLLAVSFFIKKKRQPVETVINQEGVTSLEGVEEEEVKNNEVSTAKDSKDDESELL